MKRLLIAGTIVLALATSRPVQAAPVVFDYTGSLVTFTVPTSGLYQILAFGAQGGNLEVDPFGIIPGGLGAEIGGDFSLIAGEILSVAVGGRGNNGAGGGGGGSFVVGPGNVPLVIAGGGGGAGRPRGATPGQGGLTGPDGGGIGGGTGGNGGSGGDGGAGGGGFFSAGGNARLATGGGAFPDLAGGLPGGGFGGGGGSLGDAFGFGGGGGGYSGGGAARAQLGGEAPAGGGGSFDAGTNQILMADFQIGNGEVIITEIAAKVPEPASLAILVMGLLGLTVVRLRRSRS
jgi:hypothetical protein